MTQNYLSTVVTECNHCKASSTPPPNRKVSLSSLNRNFNEIVCMDHCFLDSVTVFHVMDVATRYSAGAVVDNKSIDTAIYSFEQIWISQFWPPGSIQADNAFVENGFDKLRELYDIELRPVPPRRHQKSPIEPRHSTIRSIFLRLKSASPSTSDALHAIRAIRISNDLYGLDKMSAFEMAKGFSKPLMINQKPIPVDDELRIAHDELIAKRKLTLILRSNATTNESFKIGDLVQIYIKDGKQKRGSWTSPRQILSIDVEAGSITVPGKAGKTICAAVEDARAAQTNSDLAAAIQDSIDELDMTLADSINPSQDENQDSDNNVQSEDNNHQHSTGDFDMDSDSEQLYTAEDNQLPETGERVEIFWPLENQFFSGTIGNVHEDGTRDVHYDDDDFEVLNLDTENWKLETTASALQAGFEYTLHSNEQDVLSNMVDKLGHKPFLRHHAQAFDQAPLINAYRKEEDNFLSNVKIVPRSCVPVNANVIGSHTIYKIKANDDQTLKLKARIAPHGNEDSDKSNLRSDCNMCPPIGIRIVSSTATIRKWRVVRADAETAFLQTGPAARDVYVIPPRESTHRNTLWLLLAAAYGLINSNAKWQHQSDLAFFKLGLQQVKLIPQLFIKMEDGDVVMVVVKMFDDVLLTGKD